MKYHVSFSALLLIFFGAQAQAVPCAQTDTGVFLTGGSTQAWSDCEDGSGANDPFPSPYIGFPDMTYDALQKINYGNGGQDSPTTEVDINLVITPTGAATNGTWEFTPVAAYNQYVIVLKDGGAYTGPNWDVGVKWAAYLLDSSLFDDATWRGDWIFGYDNSQIPQTKPKEYEQGNLKNLSHLSVYGKFVEDGGEGPPEEIPVPGTFFLLGLGLLGLRFRSKA
jgi:hypothetical protein